MGGPPCSNFPHLFKSLPWERRACTMPRLMPQNAWRPNQLIYPTRHPGACFGHRTLCLPTPRTLTISAALQLRPSTSLGQRKGNLCLCRGSRVNFQTITWTHLGSLSWSHPRGCPVILDLCEVREVRSEVRRALLSILLCLFLVFLIRSTGWTVNVVTHIRQSKRWRQIELVTWSLPWHSSH